MSTVSTPFDSPVPGKWLLSLPFAPATVEIRRYTAPSRIPIPPAESSADAVRRAALEALLADGGDDVLEKAWRAINGVGANDAGGGVEKVLHTPCAIVTASGGGMRELWVFETRGPNGGARDRYHNDALDSLNHVLQGSESFLTTDMLSCASHSNPSACLSNPSSLACDVQWNPGRLARSWRLFTWAVVEKLAWRNGRRFCVAARSKDNASCVSLRPFASQHLILSLDLANQPLSISKTPSHTILLPIRSPAIQLSSFEPTSAQLEYLERSFAKLLGPDWDKRSERSILDSGGLKSTQWGVYWVTPPGGGRDPVDPKSNDRSRGSLVVWPTCLTSGDLPPSPPNGRSRKRAIAPVSDTPAAEELMGIASGLFDFLSTYNEPPPPEPVPPPESLSAAGDLPTPQTGPRGSDSSPNVPLDAEPQSEAIEEDDDLFSSNSSSPAPPQDIPLAVGGLADEMVPGTADDFDDLFGESGEEEVSATAPATAVELDRDFEMGSPEVDMRGGEYEYEAADEITADDFAFLDSPAGAEPEKEEDAEDTGAGAPPASSEQSQPEGRSVDSAAIAPEAISGPADRPVSNHERRLDLEADPPHPLSNKSQAIEPRISHAPTSTSDLIPSSFAPLNIVRPTSVPSPVHTFPTPAPTPESHTLRDDLVERLRQAKRQKADDDYTLAWHIEDTPSEPEEEFDDSGAPPTPMSEDESNGTDEGDERSQTGGDKAREQNGGVLEWRGARCIGAELVWVRDDQSTWDAVSRPWQAEWEPANPAGLLSPPASPITEIHLPDAAVDVDRLAAEIIANRYFRQSFSADQRSSITSDSDLGPLTTGGTPLSDILSPAPLADANPSRALASCNVHAGFAGNVMRLHVAGVRYWRQLGLSPVGGEKEVRAVVVTEMRDGLRRAGVGLLDGMRTVWAQHHLGTHTARAEGVVQVQSTAELSATISDLIRDSVSGQNLVIYLLLSDESEIPPLAALQPPLPEATIIHIVYTSSIQSRQLPDLAMDVYNRIRRPLHPIASTPLQTPTLMQYPSFTLAPDQAAKPSLTLQWPLRSYDVLNRWRYVHAAYTYDAPSGVIVAFIIDAEGENYEVKTFRTKGTSVSERLKGVWEWCKDFAGRAAIEWRMSLTRVGRDLRKEEVEGWRDILPGSHVTLLVVDPAPLESIGQSITSLPAPAPVLSDPSARITDDTLSARTSTYSHRLPLSLTGEDEPSTIYPLLSFVLGIAGLLSPSGTAAATYHVLSHRPAPGKEDEKVDEVLSREFQKLVYLGRLRFGFDGGAVGVHVAGVMAVRETLGRMGRGEKGGLT